MFVETFVQIGITSICMNNYRKVEVIIKKILQQILIPFRNINLLSNILIK